MLQSKAIPGKLTKITHSSGNLHLTIATALPQPSSWFTLTSYVLMLCLLHNLTAQCCSSGWPALLPSLRIIPATCILLDVKLHSMSHVSPPHKNS